LTHEIWPLRFSWFRAFSPQHRLNVWKTPMRDGLFRHHEASPFSGLLYGLAGVAIFGLTLPATRIAVAEIDAFVVGLGRALIAAFFAGLCLLAMRAPLPPRRLWPGLAIVACGLVLGFPLFATLAMVHAPASHGGVVLAVLPLATAMAGVWLAGERPSRGFWLAGAAGSALAFGFALADGAGEEGFALADLYLAAAVVCAAAGYAQSGPLARSIGGWPLICWALVLSAPAIAVVLAILSPPIDWGASPQAWGGFIYAALMSQFIGFFFWNRALAIGGVAKTGQLQLLQPFVTLAASAALLGEAVGWRHVLFALGVIACVALSRRMRVAAAAH
jgi:drug/metabolite transporter (DMT)-like permease